MQYRQKLNRLYVGLAVMLVSSAHAGVTVPIRLVSATGEGKPIGNVTLEDAFGGVLLTPNLHDLPSGVHGFHIHLNPSCADNGMAAGGHFDPERTDKHKGPYDHASHRGDLLLLVVNSDGDATLPTLAPRVTVSQLEGHSLMIHAGGDNYSDTPEKLGGGGARIACGVISK